MIITVLTFIQLHFYNIIVSARCVRHAAVTGLLWSSLQVIPFCVRKKRLTLRKV